MANFVRVSFSVALLQSSFCFFCISKDGYRVPLATLALALVRLSSKRIISVTKEKRG